MEGVEEVKCYCLEGDSFSFFCRLTACVFLTRDTVCHPRCFVFGKFVRKPNCSWSEAFVNRGLTVQYLLLFHGNNGYSNMSQCYIISTLPVLFHIVLWTLKYSHTLLFSADVPVQLCSTDGKSLHYQTPIWYRLLGSVYENSGFPLRVHVAWNKVWIKWLIHLRL